MTRLFLAAGVAALAIATPAAADRGDRGGGKKSQAAKVERGGGSQSRARAERRAPTRQVRAERRGGSEARSSRGSERRAVRQAARRDDDRRSARVERRSRSDDRRVVRAERRNDDRRVVRAERRNDERRSARVENRRDRDDRIVRVARDNRRDRRIELRGDRDDRVLRIADRDWDGDRRWVNARGLMNACPPGLAKKGNGCLPPGQAKKLVGSVLPAAYRDRVLPLSLRDIYRDDDDYYYRYGDGYAYRVDRDRNLVSALLPLLGGGYMVGDRFPSMYQSSYLPDYYRPFYRDSGDDYYRYANGYIYEVDRSSGFVEDVVPAYGYGYGVGQMWPSSYSYYNVPYQYRDMYYDTDDYYYRYAPGAIYQVDRDSSLITSVASLLTGGMAVGQPLPLGYDAYNVPYAYRDQYYDTNDHWYRYANGNIYQVDPTTRLITALIAAVV